MEGTKNICRENMLGPLAWPSSLRDEIFLALSSDDFVSVALLVRCCAGPGPLGERQNAGIYNGFG